MAVSNIFIFQSILSGISGGAEHMDAVIENVGSVVQNVANNIDDNGDEDYGFTSLLRANNDSVQFPDTYVPRMKIIICLDTTLHIFQL